MRRLYAIAGLLFGGALFLAGCASATSGTVTSKQHRPAYTVYVPTCFGYDGKGICTVWVPMPYDQPECYEVNFYNDQEDREGSVCVDSAEYGFYRLGDHYPRER
ncbi:hypothetical protein ACWEF6_01805 [Amycolatopsis sp. NPDC004772]